MIYLLLSIICSASMAIVLKIFHTQTGNRYGILLGNYLTCILIAFFMLPEKGLVFAPAPATVLCGLVGGFFFVVALVTMQSSIRANGAILTTAFSRLGLLIPLAVSIFVFGEKPDIRQFFGILLVLAALLLLNAKEDQTDTEGRNQVGSFILLPLTLLTFGCGDTISKVFERIGTRSQDQLLFFDLFVTAAILTVGLVILEYRKTGKKVLGRELTAGILVGIPNYFASAFLLQALVRLPAFFVYPACSTCTILLVMVVSAIFFQERPTKRQYAGVGMILLALVLLS